MDFNWKTGISVAFCEGIPPWEGMGWNSQRSCGFWAFSRLGLVSQQELAHQERGNAAQPSPTPNFGEITPKCSPGLVFGVLAQPRGVGGTGG